MSIQGDGNLHIYLLNVGQGDTSVIVLPSGRLVLIDAVRPDKLTNLLGQLGLARGDTIDHLLITHPHTDHYSGANRLAEDYDIAQATLSPYWNGCAMGPPTYRKFVARLEDRGTSVHFQAGYSRWLPEGALDAPAEEDPALDPAAPAFEFLGPSNSLVRALEDAGKFDTNHLSVMVRLSWHSFRMIFAGDAQMENWAGFDSERLFDGGCTVLKAAHHGSGNGTQWERLDRLSPRWVLIPSSPDQGHNLPDIVGAAVFARYSMKEGDGGAPENIVAVTSDNGTMHILVQASAAASLTCFRESIDGMVRLDKPSLLDISSNKTDWAALLKSRTAQLFP